PQRTPPRTMFPVRRLRPNREPAFADNSSHASVA
ncbi:MAG: hypothetical protein ACI90M_003103, partial [Candidatus Azotimanducaceae bacterium]